VQFIEWLHAVQLLAARDMLARHSRLMQVHMFAEEFPMDLLRKMLVWDWQHAGMMLWDPFDSYAHFMMQQDWARHFTTRDGLRRLREFVACCGEAYLRYVPPSDLYARDTLAYVTAHFDVRD